MGFFDESMLILFLVVILLGFEIQIVKIHQAIAKLKDRIEKK